MLWQICGEPPAFQPWFSGEPIRDFRSSLRADHALGMRFTEGLQGRGIVKAHEKFFVSTAHGEAEVDTTLEAAKEVAQALSRKRD